MSDSETAQMDTSALWDKYRSSLFYLIRRKTNGPMTDVGLQMVTEPMEANWYSYDKNLALIANRVSKYGSNYETTANSIPKQYEGFLNNIEIINSNAAPELKQQHAKVTSDLLRLEDQMDEEMITCATQYDEISMYTPISYDEFEKTFCPNVEFIATSIRSIKGKLIALNSAVQGEFSDVLTGISDLVSDTDRDWTDNGALKNFVANANNGKNDPIEYLLQSQTDIAETRTWYKKKTSGFLFFKKTSSVSRVEHRFESEHFDMSIKAESFGAIRVNPTGKWFKPSLIQKYKNNKQLWRNKDMSYFGEQGTLPMMPLTYYVMYKPSVVLSVSQKDGYFFEENKSSSFTFGPFASKSGSTLKVEKRSENDYRVTFDTNSEEPVVVAVENHVF